MTIDKKELLCYNKNTPNKYTNICSERMINMAVLKVTDSDFKKRVLSNPKTVVADISTDWCPSCKLLEPFFKEASDNHGELDFVSVNASDSPETAAAYKVEYVPTLLVFKNGECVKRSVGAMDKAALEEFLSDL